VFVLKPITSNGSDSVIRALKPQYYQIIEELAGVATMFTAFLNLALEPGVTKLLFDSPKAHGYGKILGGGLVGTHASDMIGEIALAIELGANAVDIGKTIHSHPTLGESICMAGEVAHGSCTDLQPARK
jgi:pyruvate/2-oxoglutarate dehydrogenase complex dihydrolipoamide dehydrogenase (E3) component